MGGSLVVQHCFPSVGVLAAVSLATEPSWMSSNLAIESCGCKCEPKDQILSTRSHATRSIFSSTTGDGYRASHGGGDYG